MARTTLFGRYQTAEPSRSLGRMHLYGGAPLKEVDHEPKVGVLDQEGLFAQGIHVSQFIPNAVDVDALGSCTAQTSTEGLSNVLSQDEFFKTTGASSYDDVVAAQKFAITFYHLCTDQTGDPGQEWPPTDCGSSGPYIVKQMETMGLIDGDRVGNTAESLISLMQADGICVGQPWFTSWMTPDAHGFIDGGGSADALQAAINSGLAGGHETYWSAVENLVLTETGLVDPFKTVLRARNSWSKSFADNGSYRFHLSTYLMLVAQCDFRALVPVAEPE